MNSTLQLFVSVKEVNISTLISTNFEFQCVFCERLWLWGYPTLLALGLIGNALCLVAFVEHKLRIETRFLCTFLAAIESLSLLITFATRWPDSAFGVSPANLHLLLCYTITIANYWLPELASWTLVVISIERVLSGNSSFNSKIIRALNPVSPFRCSRPLERRRKLAHLFEKYCTH